MIGDEKVGAEAEENTPTDPAALDPAAANARAEAIDGSTDGDGVARFNAEVDDPGLE